MARAWCFRCPSVRLILLGMVQAVLKGASGIPGVLVGDFEVVQRTLRLGEQLGNKFSVIVRHLTGTEEDTTAAIKSLKRNGFVNYFGHQRFGNSAASMMPSVEVGKLISKGGHQGTCTVLMFVLPCMYWRTTLFWELKETA